MTGEVFVASQGGNVFEALEIGYLIRRLRLSTDAPSQPPPSERSSGNEIIHPNELTNPKNYLCTSACFLIFVAGIYREFVWAGRLGIHHPRLEYKPIGTTENEVSMADDDIRNKLKTYLEEMNVPDKYLTLMYSTAPNGGRLITQAEFNADLKGYVPQLRDLLRAKCLKPDDRNCIRQATAQLRAEAGQKIFNPGGTGVRGMPFQPSEARGLNVPRTARSKRLRHCISQAGGSHLEAPDDLPSPALVMVLLP